MFCDGEPFSVARNMLDQGSHGDINRGTYCHPVCGTSDFDVTLPIMLLSLFASYFTTVYQFRLCHQKEYEKAECYLSMDFPIASTK